MGGQLSDFEIETEDLAEILLQFKNGAVGSIHLDYVQYPESRSCQVIGTEGTITWDNVSAKVGVYTKAKKEWQYFPEPAGWISNQMFLDETRHFLNCLEDKEKPLHTLADAKRVLEIALQVKDGLTLQRGKL
jgi:predicted dehydrogenase